MQLIPKGPNIPDELINAHERGRVVFFCGAGISIPAGLCDFKELVDKIYIEICTDQNSLEKLEYEKGKYDTLIELLEQRFPGERSDVRQALKKILQPDYTINGALDTHIALLKLSLFGDELKQLRLVTTNFDRIFEDAAIRIDQPHNSYIAPMLPVPKNSRWDGLVYLHGLLPEKENDEAALQQLVLSSGDFGSAYLNERWASRFVSELFRNYIICFVGYSIDDPIMRYMMDALSADKMRGEKGVHAYAFAGVKEGEKRNIAEEWEAKGVEPILYRVLPTRDDEPHSLFHKTIQAWSELYHSGIEGKKRIISEYAFSMPTVSTQEDNFVGRMLWALSDKSGIPANHFANLNPAPPLEWLYVFSDTKWPFEDNMLPEVDRQIPKYDDKYFTLLHRPTPDLYYSRMFVCSKDSYPEFDNVMLQLMRWLLQYLNDPRLILWLTAQGGDLHPRFRRMLEWKLDNTDELVRDSTKKGELDRLLGASPFVVPNSFMRKLWHLFATGVIGACSSKHDFYSWLNRYEKHGLTIALRMELREILTPKIVVSEKFRFFGEEKNPTSSLPEDILEVNVSVGLGDVPALLSKIKDDTNFHCLAKDFEALLLNALDLLSEFGYADEFNDRSKSYFRSIDSSKYYSFDIQGWTVLVELLRESWLKLLKVNKDYAIEMARLWWQIPYPIFRRLALFAASKDSSIPPEDWVDWILYNEASALWSVVMQREVMRLIFLRGEEMNIRQKNTFEKAIMAGPSDKSLFNKKDIDYLIWHRLAKLNAAGVKLGKKAKKKLSELSQKYIDWKLPSNQSDEFTLEPVYSEKKRLTKMHKLPTKKNAIIKWLKRDQAHDKIYYENNWSYLCKRHPMQTGYALISLSQNGIWPTYEWKQAFYAWSENNPLSRYTWSYLSHVISDMPGNEMGKMPYELTWWMKRASYNIREYEDLMYKLCGSLIELQYEDKIRFYGELTDVITDVINNPTGRVIEILMGLLFKNQPKDNSKLPNNIESIFTKICSLDTVSSLYGKIALAAYSIQLYRIDAEWSKKYLIPLFDWNKNAKVAQSSWIGLLRTNRVYSPLMIELKSYFLEIPNRYPTLGKWKKEFVEFLTYIAINSLNGYTIGDLKRAFKLLPVDGIEFAAKSLYRILNNSNNESADVSTYWENKIRPFWKNVWPKSKNLISEKASESLALFCVASMNKFHDALDYTQSWIKRIKHPVVVVEKLSKSGLCKKFPEDSLKLLYLTIGEDYCYPMIELPECLKEISEVAAELKATRAYKRLEEYVERNK